MASASWAIELRQRGFIGWSLETGRLVPHEYGGEVLPIERWGDHELYGFFAWTPARELVRRSDVRWRPLTELSDEERKRVEDGQRAWSNARSGFQRAFRSAALSVSPRCVACDSLDDLQGAHAPMSALEITRVLNLKAAHDPVFAVTLCRPCHRMHDSGAVWCSEEWTAGRRSVRRRVLEHLADRLGLHVDRAGIVARCFFIASRNMVETCPCWQFQFEDRWLPESSGFPLAEGLMLWTSTRNDAEVPEEFHTVGRRVTSLFGRSDTLLAEREKLLAFRSRLAAARRHREQQRLSKIRERHEPERQRILDAIRTHGEPVSAEQIAMSTGFTRAKVYYELNQSKAGLVRRGLVAREKQAGSVSYSLAASAGGASS